MRFIRTYGIGARGSRSSTEIVRRHGCRALLLALTEMILELSAAVSSRSLPSATYKQELGSRFEICYDVDHRKAQVSLDSSRCARAGAAADVIGADVTRFVYIVSNHSSHADYAIQSLGHGKITYIEKPISVSMSSSRGFVNRCANRWSRLCWLQ